MSGLVVLSGRGRLAAALLHLLRAATAILLLALPSTYSTGTTGLLPRTRKPVPNNNI